MFNNEMHRNGMNRRRHFNDESGASNSIASTVYNIRTVSKPGQPFRRLSYLMDFCNLLCFKEFFYEIGCVISFGNIKCTFFSRIDSVAF